MKQTRSSQISNCDDLLSVLILLKQVTMESTKVATLAYVKRIVTPFNNKYGVLEVAPFPLIDEQLQYKLQVYFFSDIIYKEGDIILVVFTDRNFISNLSVDEPKKTNDSQLHTIKYGVAIKV